MYISQAVLLTCIVILLVCVSRVVWGEAGPLHVSDAGASSEAVTPSHAKAVQGAQNVSRASHYQEHCSTGTLYIHSFLWSLLNLFYGK